MIFRVGHGRFGRSAVALSSSSDGHRSVFGTSKNFRVVERWWCLVINVFLLQPAKLFSSDGLSKSRNMKRELFLCWSLAISSMLRNYVVTPRIILF